jgi:hypothetical protein
MLVLVSVCRAQCTWWASQRKTKDAGDRVRVDVPCSSYGNGNEKKNNVRLLGDAGTSSAACTALFHSRPQHSRRGGLNLRVIACCYHSKRRDGLISVHDLRLKPCAIACCKCAKPLP